MNSQRIISDIKQIYTKYNVPPNLQEHMYRVAAVSSLICDNWKLDNISKDDIIAVALVHDLGNIVKMDFESEQGLKMIGNEINNLDFWKEVKQKTINKYGSDDHIVTEQILNELLIDSNLITITKEHIFKNGENLIDSNSWNKKFAYYSDLRVGPYGVLTLEQRFTDLKERYKKKGQNYIYDPKLDILIECAFKIEKQLLDNTKLKQEMINDQNIKIYLDKFH